MSVKEIVGALGGWNVRLTSEVPEEVRSKLGIFGHVAIVRGKIDDPVSVGDTLLSSARYVGVVRRIGKDEDRSLSGVGMEVWLGDEEDKGEVLESKVTLTNATLTAAITAVLPDAVTIGTIHALTDPSKRITTTFQWVTPRKAIQAITAYFGVEYRVNGNGTIDVGRQDQLYTSVPKSMIRRREAGVDMDLVAAGGTFETETVGDDYTSRTVVVGRTEEDGTFFVADADAPSVPYFDLHGNPVKRTRLINDSTVDNNNGQATADLNLNRFARLGVSLKVDASGFELEGTFRAGDMTYVYDPDTGLTEPSREVYFRGSPIHPQIIRINEFGWTITEGHTVLFRTVAGEWVDLTRWVEWESSSNELVVGDLPKSLTSPGSNPILDRADQNTGKANVPNAPTALLLETDSLVDPISGMNSSIVRASWTAPTANTDGTPLVDLSHYLVQYRPELRDPLWQSTTATELVTVDLPAVVGLEYDVRVAAVDTSGNVSAWTAVASIVAAADETAPPAPADPVGSVYLGLPRFRYLGTDNLGNPMPSDTNRVVVEIGPSAAGPWTEVSYLTPQAEGVAYAPASAYGVPVFGRLIAYDHAGNASAPSGSVSVTPVKAAASDITSLSVGQLTAGTIAADVVNAGRIATALTGARRELNAVGFQAWDSGNNLVISLDGVNNLLTGRYRSALTGRRIEFGAAGLLGEIEFIAPDGTTGVVRAFTESTGIEALQFGIPMATSDSPLWNRININSDEWMNIRAENVDVAYLNGGFFAVRQRSSRNNSATTTTRLQIDNLNFQVYAQDGRPRYQAITGWSIVTIPNDGTFRVQEDNAGTMEPRFSVLKSNSWFEWPETGSRVVILTPGARNDLSGILQLANGFNFVTQLRYLSTSGGGSARLEIRDAGSGYVNVTGGTYTDSSSRETKVPSSIRDYSGGLATVKAARPKTFRRKPLTGRRDRYDEDGRLLGHDDVVAAEPGPETLGFIAEEVPEEWQTRDENGAVVGIQYGAQIASLVAAVHELDAEIETLKKGGRP